MATKKTTVKENAGKKRKEKPEIVTPEITVTRKRRIVFAGSEAAPFIAAGWRTSWALCPPNWRNRKKMKSA